jgi:hypothetical protein
MKKIAVMLIVLTVIGVGLLSGCTTTIEYKLQITSFQVEKGEGTGSGDNISMPYTATVKIANNGNNNVNDAELNVTLFKNNNIVDSQIKQLGNVGKSWELTQQVIVSDVHWTNNATYKVLATITHGGTILDYREMTV